MIAEVAGIVVHILAERIPAGHTAVHILAGHIAGTGFGRTAAGSRHIAADRIHRRIGRSCQAGKMLRRV